MRNHSLTFVPLLLLACEQPTAPRAVAAPTFQATTEWLRYPEYWEWTETVPCRGNAEFRFHGDVDVSWHLVSSSGGRLQFQLKILPTETFVGEELSTGTVFALNPGTAIIVHDVEGSDKGGTWWVRNKWTFEAPNGDKITQIWDLHLAWNANGDLVVEHERAYEFKCVVK